MVRYQILIEYDGSSFIGWQIQNKGNSVQKLIQSIFKKLYKRKIKVYGSGRTDTGVHAIEQSAHFEIDKKIPDIKKFIKSLNFFLNKKNVSILNIIQKDGNFHSRYSARERTYLYLIRNSISPSVLNKNKEWHVVKKLDINKLKKAASCLTGTHNFSTFRASNCDAKSSIKTIRKIQISKSKSLIKIRFMSKSFLKSQVRSMVGCLKYVGQNKWDIKKFIYVINSKKRENCAPLAPAKGLYLEKVKY
tara:strand:- start:55 stop:795 length:741 start_codon:yes stop_codon:yes gene_type:complete